jgi:hypothetical protein
MKKMETALSKVVAMSTKAEGSEAATKQYCTLCKKFGHDDSYYFNNPDIPNNWLSKIVAKGTMSCCK